MCTYLVCVCLCVCVCVFVCVLCSCICVCVCVYSTDHKQVIQVKKTRGAAAPCTRITCELFGKPKNAVCI